jgi:hypothetical protein
VQFLTRLGTRWGSIEAEYNQNMTTSLQNIIRELRKVQGRGPLEAFIISNDIKEPEMFLGFFATTGVAFKIYNFGGMPVDLTIAGEIEVSVDIFDPGNFGNDYGLSTFSPLGSLMVSW